jgi:L-glyceraldehyde 3-phosphate reductase
LSRVRNLHAIAEQRGQTLAQIAIAWSLRDPRVTSALLGARSPAQLNDSLGAFNNLVFIPDELMQIDRQAIDTPDIDLWRSVNSRDEQVSELPFDSGRE